ncbi:MAG: right-handed parallel beta-helix repeat-containing protein [Candidatus Celaenobacter antarcticus]|nr:right-handed parallel beta-helix repeat-containing protein [Candidatus Celaenobacter antarcticus]
MVLIVASITQEDYITVTNSNDISGDVAGVWKTTFSPYTITDDVSIPDGCELTIEPDVQIITNNNSKIEVQGKLVADASGKGSIQFISNDSWKGIQFLNSTEDNLIQNCEITNATYCAVDIENSKVDIIENTIYENSTATQKGAAINVIGLESVYIYKNLIANNTSSTLCAGIGCDNANPLISHNIIVNNTASFAGAISLKNSSNPTMINNTIANNESTSGYGAMWFASSSATVNNCILIDDLDVFTLFGSTVNVTYTCISGGYNGTGNIDGDPMFENPTAGSGTGYNGLEANWSLLEDSPCIDTGDPNSPLDPDGSCADMGALYFNHIAVDPQIQNGGISLNNYPNPFKNSTIIEYNINKIIGEEPVEIKIYNIKGQLVDTIKPKDGMVVWEAESFPAGVYFYQLKIKSNKVIEKMILLH